MRILIAAAAGLVFGTGLAVSGMTDPAKVTNFLDVAGTWDPSLAFVMAGAIAVTCTGYRLVTRRSRPLLAARFNLPEKSAPDGRLVAGAAVFGIGWGLAGFCPGPAVAALALGAKGTLIFVPSMLAGMAAARLWLSRQQDAEGRKEPDGHAAALPPSGSVESTVRP